MILQLGFQLSSYIPASIDQYIPSWIPNIFRAKIDDIYAQIRANLVALVDQQQSVFEQKLSDLVNTIVGPLLPIFTLVTQFKTNTIDVFSRASTLVTSIENEYFAIRDFKENLHWRGRVVSVPAILKKIRRLAEIPGEIASRVKDLITQVKTKLDPAAINVEELEGIEDFRGAAERFGPKFAKGIEKALGVFALIVDALVTISTAIEDLQVVVNDVREVRLDIEQLDLVFLQQNNARRVEQLADGRTIKIRVGGKLHPQ